MSDEVETEIILVGLSMNHDISVYNFGEASEFRKILQVQ